MKGGWSAVCSGNTCFLSKQAAREPFVTDIDWRLLPPVVLNVHYTLREGLLVTKLVYALECRMSHHNFLIKLQTLKYHLFKKNKTNIQNDFLALLDLMYSHSVYRAKRVVKTS